MKKKIETLDGARGVAAIAVVLYHLGQWNELRWFAPHGYLAVDFFFCLSGFVMALAYGERLKTSLTFSAFFWARVRRLYPIVLIGACLGAVYYGLMAVAGKNQPFTLPDVAEAFVLNVFLIPYIGFKSAISDANFPINSPFWSLFYEMLINVAWALFLRQIPSWLAFGVSSALVLLVFFYSGESITHPGEYEPLMNLLRVSIGFSGGLFAFDIWKRHHTLSAVPPIAVLVVLALVLLMPAIVGPWYDQLCMIILFPVLTVAGALAVASVRQAVVLEWLGDVSYPLYGTHRPLCQLMLLVFAKVNLGAMEPILAIAVPLVVSVAIAWVVFKHYDEPARKWLGGLNKRPATNLPRI